MRESTGPSNPHELAFYSWAVSQGWQVTKQGWPDFICRRRGEVMAVEVKGGKDFVRPEQWAAIYDLRKAGLPTFVWTLETGLQDVSGAPLGESILRLEADNAQLRKLLAEVYNLSMRVQAVPAKMEMLGRWADEEAMVLAEMGEWCKAHHDPIHHAPHPYEAMTRCAWIVKMGDKMNLADLAQIVGVDEERLTRQLIGLRDHRDKFLTRVYAQFPKRVEVYVGKRARERALARVGKPTP